MKITVLIARRLWTYRQPNSQLWYKGCSEFLVCSLFNSIIPIWHKMKMNYLYMYIYGHNILYALKIANACRIYLSWIYYLSKCCIIMYRYQQMKQPWSRYDLVTFIFIATQGKCFTRLLENFLNLSDIRSDRKILHARPGNFLSDKFLFCIEHLNFLYRTFGLTRF